MPTFRPQILVAAAKHRRDGARKAWFLVLSLSLAIPASIMLEIFRQIEYMASGATHLYDQTTNPFLTASLGAFVILLIYTLGYALNSQDLTYLEYDIAWDNASRIPEILDRLTKENNAAVADLAETIIKADAVNIEKYIGKFTSGAIDDLNSAVEGGFLIIDKENPQLKKFFNDETAPMPFLKMALLQRYVSDDVADAANMLFHELFNGPALTPRLKMKLDEQQTVQCQRLADEIAKVRARTGTKLTLIG